MLKQGIQRRQPTVLPGWLDRVTKASQNFLDSKGQGEWADGTSCPELPAEGAPARRCASVSPHLDWATYVEITGNRALSQTSPQQNHKVNFLFHVCDLTNL